MKKRVLATMMLCVFLTGCQTDVSSIVEGIKGELEDVSSDAGAEASVEATSEDSGDDTTTASASEADYKLYDDLIADLKAAKESGSVGNLDVSKKIFSAPKGEEYDFSEVYGYLKKDLDGDGTDELILGSNSYIEGLGIPLGKRYDTYIYDIFTINDGKLVHVVNCGENESYYFGPEGEIIREEWGLEKPIDLMATFSKFNKDKLELVDGIRQEYHEDAKESEEYKNYYSDKDPYKDVSNEIEYEKWHDIVGKHGNAFVKFTPFEEPAKTTKNYTVYTNTFEEDYLDSAIQYLWKSYVILFDDNTGIVSDYGGEGRCYMIKWDDKEITTTGWVDGDGKLQAVNDSSPKPYSIDGDKLKFGEEEYIKEDR
ncbi:MAG: hypothetical protein J5504_01955 [Butyrivibrio sp.]|nr:hypothetical protein [Butyrivibrio sp.]